jgi:hypothetical protein
MKCDCRSQNEKQRKGVKARVGDFVDDDGIVNL